MSDDLADRRCPPCRGGVPPLAPERIAELMRELGPSWTVVDGHHLERRWRLADWQQAIELVGRLGELAEEADHHPQITLGWGRVEVELYTHAIDGLSESDFVLAARFERAASAQE